jgi:hypothetical protein
MDDAVFVRRLERFCALAGQPEGVFLWNGTSCNALSQGLAFNELQHERRCATRFSP